MQKVPTQQDLILYTHVAAAFQILRAGVELDIFELLNKHSPLTLNRIATATKLPQQSARTLLFGLAVLRLLVKSGDKYSNSKVIHNLFSGGEWRMFRRLVLLQAHIMYLGQVDYVESLKRSKNIGVGRYPGKGKTIYERIAFDKKLKEIFFEYMEAYSEYANPHLIRNINFSKVHSVLDVGGGAGGNAIALAQAFPNTILTLLDLPMVAPFAKAKIKKYKLSSRIKFYPADMFKNKFPKNQDAVVFIHQLVIWSEKQNELLLKKAYRALNKGGQVVIFSSVSDDTEEGPLMAALDTVYFRSIAAGNGMIYPWKDYEKLLRKIGFKKIQRTRCKTWTPHGVIIAHK